MSGEAPEADVAAAAPGTGSAQVEAEEPVQSIEQDGEDKDGADNDGNDNEGDERSGDGRIYTAPNPGVASEVTDDQWRSMMDVVMAIYDFREEEFVPYFLAISTLFTMLMRDYTSVTMIRHDSFIAVSINGMFLITTTLSKNLWRLVF